jgi:hypothetical protein
MRAKDKWCTRLLWILEAAIVIGAVGYAWVRSMEVFGVR